MTNEEKLKLVKDLFEEHTAEMMDQIDEALFVGRDCGYIETCTDCEEEFVKSEMFRKDGIAGLEGVVCHRCYNEYLNEEEGESDEFAPLFYRGCIFK